ncbi:MAG TPA: MarR family transcriptional regulator, partial [Ktedonobacterales bacterium]|nr:MarR family transcriptional regulator [Ktedonobacterales bacterium]
APDERAAPAQLDHEHERGTLRVWLRLLSCATLIENQVSGRLRREFATTLPRFDLMAQLARFPDGLTMGELSQRLMVSGGNVTGVTDTLERDGLVERVPQPGDRRARIVRLTKHGRTSFERIAAAHAGWIEELLGGLAEPERQQLYGLLGRLKTHLTPPAPLSQTERRK